MIEVSFLAGELVFAGIWLILRIIIWSGQKKIVWKREAALMLMLINLAVIIRLVFYPFFRVEGKVQPLILNLQTLKPFRINLEPLVHIFAYDSKKEALINTLGNILMFVPTGIILPILYKRLNSFWKVVAIGAAMSLAIELIQLLFPNSTTDIDDLILNTLGVILGYEIYRLFRRKH